MVRASVPKKSQSQELERDRVVNFILLDDEWEKDIS